ncbi:MAG: hypothetical protein K9G58_08895 [Bacteroidales bacterium]|nr:hypothetical protein [Bacteroidales bacterium]MCF8388402.1 hypothetical protein [Bacteroidales bacterium]MCF8398271.1 hypothetical protein [Bacteroidales bacterium]
MPSFSIAEVYICDEENYLEVLSAYKNAIRFQDLLRSIDWGLKNVLYSGEKPDFENNEEYQRLSRQLHHLSE